MVRPLRIEYPKGGYNLMNRGRRGEDIFSDKNDYKIFLAMLRKSTEMSRVMRHLNG